MDYTTPIKLGIAEKLKQDKEYRRAFFRASATDSIALQIRQLRKLRALKQAELAAAAEMKQSAVSRIEQAEYSAWSFNTLSRVADALESRLIITFQPMEIAVKEFEAAERRASTSEAPVYISTGEVVNKLSPFKSETRKLTEQPKTERISDTKQKLVIRIPLGATAHG